MWDPSLLDGNSEPIRVLEDGFKPAAAYEVSCFTLMSPYTNTAELNIKVARKREVINKQQKFLMV